jgi:hypothetical protein
VAAVTLASQATHHERVVGVGGVTVEQFAEDLVVPAG